jgi:hypothetical protein
VTHPLLYWKSPCCQGIALGLQTAPLALTAKALCHDRRAFFPSMKKGGEEAMLLQSKIRTLLDLLVFCYVQISLFFSGDLWPDFNICCGGPIGLVGSIGCSLPSSFLDECIGCYCTSIRCDWITRKSVNVASKDVTSSPFFVKTLTIIGPGGCKLSH